MSTIRLSHRGRVRAVSIAASSATIDGRSVPLDRVPGAVAVETLEVGGVRCRVAAVRAGDRIFVWCDGRTWEFTAAGPSRAGRASAAADHGADLTSPMPGRVRRISVAPGAAVERGDVLLLLEAMKMEHAIRAPFAGVVRRVCVAEGDLVDAGVELVELSPAATASGGRSDRAEER